ncbi:MAG: type IV conjugative transfer system protein TraL, partial [Gammaproteobacteria bacterium]|nr:type IV conjugative transfer system protein TraL [Gammaproteobacteria bacterium]
MEEVDIPRYQDALPQLFWWELDVLVVVIGIFIAGIWVDPTHLLATFVVIVFATRSMNRLKGDTLDGALHHIVYRTGLLP